MTDLIAKTAIDRHLEVMRVPVAVPVSLSMPFAAVRMRVSHQCASAQLRPVPASTTSGTDSDWVVKLIDVYPDQVAEQPEMGGYQLAVAMDIFRGRYRQDFARPQAIKPGAVERYSWTLPHVNHVFLPGHRIMVQVQSSQFPLYDRNPQTFVPNIFLARPEDYKAATVTIERGGATASAVQLPVVAVEQAQAKVR